MVNVVVPDPTLHPRVATFVTHIPPQRVQTARGVIPLMRPAVLTELALALFRGPVPLDLTTKHASQHSIRSTGGQWSKGPRAYAVNLAVGSEEPERILHITPNELIHLPYAMSEYDGAVLRHWLRGLIESSQVVVRQYDDTKRMDIDALLAMHLTTPGEMKGMTLRGLRRVMGMTLPLYRHGELTTHGVVVTKLLWLAILSQRVSEATTKEMMRLATKV